MGYTKTVSKVARVVNPQQNPNLTIREEWVNHGKATIGNNKTYATSHYTKTKYVTKYETKTTGTGKNKTTKKVPKEYGYKYNHPQVISAHDYGFTFDNTATLTKVTVYAKMRVGSGVTTEAPMCIFDVYGDAYASRKDNTKVYYSTGWNNGRYQSNKTTKLSTKWEEYKYTMDESTIKAGKFTYDDWNKTVMGVDLVFKDGKFNGDKSATAKIDLAWVKIVVEYEIPQYGIDYTYYENTYKSISKNKNSPTKFTASEVVVIEATYNQYTKGKGGTKDLKVEIPWGTDIFTDGEIGVYSIECSNSSFNTNTMTWTVPANGKQTATLDIPIVPHLEDTSAITIHNDTVGSYSCYYRANLVELVDGYDDIRISPLNEAHRGDDFCVRVDIEGISHDSTAQFTVYNNKTYEVVGHSINSEGCSSGVSEIPLTNQPNDVKFSVPANERFKASFNFCIRPFVENDVNTLSVSSYDTGKTSSYTYNVSPPYVYHITSKGSNYDDTNRYVGLRTDDELISNHRVASTLSTDMVVLPIATDSKDQTMNQSSSKIRLHFFEELDYIGCVPLEQTHFDQSSTYKDKLLDSHYKNKRYMGKELASTEDISLNVRLHPHQVTTIQGLIDMDKPIPINTNHKSFEGDALNNRGWAEIVGIKTTYTNPHWYKCDIDVSYLTHNLNTRFNIETGNAVSDYQIPELFAEVLNDSDPLSSGNQDEDYFLVSTDGTYEYISDEEEIEDLLDSNEYPIYYSLENKYTESGHPYEEYTINPIFDEDTYNSLDDDDKYEYLDTCVESYLEDDWEIHFRELEEKVKVKITQDSDNSFSIGNGQYLKIESRDNLNSVVEIVMDWESTLLPELRENNVSRITRLYDAKTGNSIFEYEYTDISIEDGELTCRVIGRVYDSVMDFTIPIDKDITFNYTPVDEDTGNEATYGSKLTFKLNGYNLYVVDEGYNGMEISEAIELPISKKITSLKYETVWENKNEDAESDDIVSSINMSVQDTILVSQYADMYGRMVVSPFPVQKKEVLFIREGEEGMIYYLKGDDEEFSYLINPYYQYMNGTDLIDGDSGSSIFNLNYGYELIYIQNGLVRLGFNRITGKMYLGKYDPRIKDYIDLFNLHLTKYDDMNVNSISDDKIEIQASDCVFTIYRGHPYIKIKHELEDIFIDTQFEKVWAESVGGTDPSDYPIYWNLMNNSNLLSSSYGGSNTINTTGISAEMVQSPPRTVTSLSWSSFPQSIDINTDTTFTVTGSVTNPSELLDFSNGDYQGNFGLYSIEETVNRTKIHSIDLYSKDIIQLNEVDNIAVYTKDYDGNRVLVENNRIDFYEIFTPSLSLNVPNPIIQVGDKANLQAKLKDEDGSLVQGVRVDFYVDDAEE